MLNNCPANVCGVNITVLLPAGTVLFNIGVALVQYSIILALAMEQVNIYIDNHWLGKDWYWPSRDPSLVMVSRTLLPQLP